MIMDGNRDDSYRRLLINNQIRSALLSLHELTQYKTTASVVLKLGKTGTVHR
jgi:hypothetical protein